ncbi:hypothetical protein Peur_029725 [Populus x canadensis]
MFNFFLLVHNSLRNFSYRGICLIASNNGILTSTFQKVSKISCFDSFFLAFANLPGNRDVTRFLIIRKTDLPFNFLLGVFKIVSYVSSLLFLVSVKSGVVTSDIFPIKSSVAASSMVCTTVAYDPGIATGWVVYTRVVVESGVTTNGIFPVESSVTASTTDPCIIASWVVCIIVAVESGVIASSIFPTESSVIATSMVCTTIVIYPSIVASWVLYTIIVAKSGIAADSIFADDSSITAGNMVYTSLPLLRLITLVFSLALIST